MLKEIHICHIYSQVFFNVNDCCKCLAYLVPPHIRMIAHVLASALCARKYSWQVLLCTDLVTPSQGEGHWNWYEIRNVRSMVPITRIWLKSLHKMSNFESTQVASLHLLIPQPASSSYSTAVQVRSSIRLMPQNQPSSRGLLPSPTAWSPDQHPAAMLADIPACLHPSPLSLYSWCWDNARCGGVCFYQYLAVAETTERCATQYIFLMPKWAATQNWSFIHAWRVPSLQKKND